MQKYLPYIITVVLCYAIGSIHPAYILGKLGKHIDIREHGSNNSGASNATVVMGFKYGAATAIIDIIKGAAALLIIGAIFKASGTAVAYHASSAVILGHIFPFYMGFKGGKGLATLLGVCFAVNKLLFLIALVVLIAVALITDYIAIGTVCTVITFFIYTCITFGVVSAQTALAAIVCVIMIVKHKDNYTRIYHKTETKVSSLYKKDKAA